MTRVAIVGGGIGGLIAAIALSRAGVDVSVHEAAAELRKIGPGVALHPNAMRVLLISNGTFLQRDDFTSRLISHGTSGGTPMAAIDWDAAITASCTQPEKVRGPRPALGDRFGLGLPGVHVGREHLLRGSEAGDGDRGAGGEEDLGARGETPPAAARCRIGEIIGVFITWPGSAYENRSMDSCRCGRR